MEKALLLYNDIKSNVLSDVEDIFFAADVKKSIWFWVEFLKGRMRRGGGGLNSSMKKSHGGLLFSILMKSKRNYFDLRLF